MTSTISSQRFYSEYKGHRVSDLANFHAITTAERSGKPIVYLAGDSSLDNKYWLPSAATLTDVPTPAIYTATLDGQRLKEDVAFWLNHFLGSNATALNAAVEASLLRERETCLLRHDAFIRDNIRSEDILIVSVGANDIAMAPNARTVLNMLLLSWMTPLSSIRKGTAWCLRYFVNMFKTDVERYISRLVERTRPLAVIACMIYYPLETQAAVQQSWADIPLKAMGYNRSPAHLQAAIASMYELATRKIQVAGVEVIPVPLYETMNGKDAEDYVQRVEPSVEGGRKMATQLDNVIHSLLDNID